MICGECGNVTAPGAGFPNHVYCKRFLLHMEKREDASRCRDFIPKPITNADRIRAMTDEELAKWLDLLVNRAKIYGENKVWLEDTPRYYTDWLGWLKQGVSTDG